MSANFKWMLVAFAGATLILYSVRDVLPFWQKVALLVGIALVSLAQRVELSAKLKAPPNTRLDASSGTGG